MKVLNGARTQDSRNRRQQKVKWGSRKSTHARTGLSTNEQLSSALCMPRFAVTFVSSLLLLPIRVRAFFLINESRTYCMDFIIASRRSLFCHISLSNLFSTYWLIIPTRRGNTLLFYLYCFLLAYMPYLPECHRYKIRTRWLIIIKTRPQN